MSQINRWASLAFALAFIPVISPAAVIVANTGSGIFNGAGQNGTTLRGVGFLSPNVATTITSVQLPLDVNNTNPNAGPVSLNLYSNNGGVPGTSLASFGSVNVAAALPPNQTFVFTPSAPVNIAASTQYWLVTFCACPGTNLNWEGFQGTSVSGMTGGSVTPGVFSSSNNGSTWSVAFSDRTPLFQVNGDVTTGGEVPEPSTFALTLGAAALLYFKRRR